MHEIIIAFVLSLVVFLAAVALLFLSVFKRSLKLVLISIILLLISVLPASYGVYLAFEKSYVKVKDSFKGRSGIEIYRALFGEPKGKCVKVLKSKDQHFPLVDCCIWLHFRSCPEEIRRMLKQEPYETDKVSTDKLTLSYSEPPAWWKPEMLGDSAIVFRYLRESEERLQYGIFSKDSSLVFYYDMLY